MESKNNLSRFKIIWRFAKKYTPLFMVAEVCILVSYAVSLLLPINLSLLVDEVLYNRQHELLLEVIRNYLLLFGFATMFNLLYGFAYQTLSNLYVVDIKNEMFRKLIFAKACFLSGMNSGDMMTRIDEDADQFIHVIQRNLFHFVNSIFLCAGIIVMVARINITIALLLIFAALLPIVFTRICGRFTQKYSQESRKVTGIFTGRLFEIIKGFREIRLSCAESWARAEVFTPLRSLIGLGNRIRRMDFFVNKGVYLVNLSASLILYGFSAALIWNGQLTIGLFLAVVEYVGLLHKKMNWIMRIYLDWYGRKASIDRVNEVLSIPGEDDGGIEIEDVESLEFNHVSFAYGGQENVLENVLFSIKQGEHTALTGASGAGKTTITGLILGFYKPTDGEILINGINLSEIKPSSIRKLLGVVSQDAVLLPDTIRHNLQLGVEYSDNELWGALEKTEMRDAVRTLPNGLDTFISVSGRELSGGQKQRLMLARLLLKNPKFIILDESTSALDTETEALVLERLRNYADGITTMIISHRLAAIKDCQRVISLEDKTVAQNETNQEGA